MAETLILLVCMSIAMAIGWAMGRNGQNGREGAYRDGYQAGWSAMREQCLRLARAHDFAMIELQLERAKPPANPYL